MNEFGDILGLVDFFLVLPIVLYTAWRLRKAHRHRPWLKVLKERYYVQRVLGYIVLVFGLIFLNNDAAIPPFDRDATRVITRFVIFLAIVPSLHWLHLYPPDWWPYKKR